MQPLRLKICQILNAAKPVNGRIVLDRMVVVTMSVYAIMRDPKPQNLKP